MTTDEAKEACMKRRAVLHNGAEYYIDYILTRWDRNERAWRNSLYLEPVSGVNSVVVAKMREVELTSE